ncbi:hypothetical protein NGRA_2504 [Nosema granulosis]|uniref:Threonyl-tRNA synthetase n=1 Tax=Nosema granulosis TaxID=83296 RepID=A0A9P6GWH0_9MICR|nr:hypothetical protein NGRA_2504 [Nosema granulosis]
MKVLFAILGVILGVDEGVTEVASDTIRYDPHGKNEFVGAKGAILTDHGLRLRQDKENGGLVLFLEDNKYEEWSFEYTISDIDLHFPEQGGVYMWYTKYDQDMGQYRGGDGHFNGLMAGIEFKGMSPEIVYVLNDGKDLDEYGEYTLHRDSFNPSRLKGVKELTVKVILTHNNFKVELYDQNNLVYDSFRYIHNHPFRTLGVDKRFSLTSFYANTSTDKSFTLKRAQLYKRTESGEYDPEKIHALHVENLPKDEHEVVHPNSEIRAFIAQFTHFLEYAKGVLGEVHKPLITVQAQKIIEKIEETNSSSFRQTVTNKINEIDRRLQQVQKTLEDLNHNLREFESSQGKRSSTLSYIVLGVGISLFLVMSFREYKRFGIKSKNL